MRKRPNVLFYFSDQQRWDTLGCYGQKLNVSPIIDSLAKEGTLFENAFTPQPVCGPARSCIQSGLYATQTGCYRNDVSFPKDKKSLAQFFSENGYETGYVGKFHLASDYDNVFHRKPVPKEKRIGFNDWWVVADTLEITSDGYSGYLFDENNEKVTFNKYRTDAVTDFALDYLEQKTSDKPFLLFVSHIEPHQQNSVDKMQGPLDKKDEFSNYELPGDLKGEGNYIENYPDYLSACNAIDRNLGRIINKLKSMGEYDNTIIVFTSDHGCHFKTREGKYKRSCHDSSIRIPLVISGPGFNKGNSRKDFASLVDLAPTLLNSCEIEVPEYMVGRDLKNENEFKSHIFGQISEIQMGRYVRTDKYTYSIRAFNVNPIEQMGNDIYMEEYLYDNIKDPNQLTNLISDINYLDVRKELKNQILTYMKNIGEKEPKIIKYDKNVKW